MHLFGRGFYRMVVCCNGLDPIEIGNLGLEVKVTVNFPTMDLSSLTFDQNEVR